MTQPLPPLTALRAFEATVRLGSVSAAAAELHVTHGAVSRQLQVLEQALGQRLLEKTGRRLSPTPAGQQLQQAATTAFNQLRQSWQALQRRPDDGPLVLGCPGSVLARWMIPRLGRLASDLPELRVHLAVLEGDLAPALEGLDAALLLGQPPWPANWQAHTLAEERIGPVFSPQLPGAATLRLAAPSAVLAQPVLHTTSRPQAWPSWLASQQLASTQLQLGAGFAHLYYLLEAAVAGLGVAIAPEPLVADDVASGRLLAPWGFAATGGQWALCTRHNHGDPRLDRLIAWLRRQLAR